MCILLHNVIFFSILGPVYIVVNKTDMAPPLVGLKI